VLSLAFLCSAALAMAPIEWSSKSENGHFTLLAAPLDGEYPIGDYHVWTLELSDANGDPINEAVINIDGGMKAHGHGLPTQPEVTRNLGDGRYLVEGMMFNMAGKWTLEFEIRTPAALDHAIFNIDLKL